LDLEIIPIIQKKILSKSPEHSLDGDMFLQLPVDFNNYEIREVLMTLLSSEGFYEPSLNGLSMDLIVRDLG